MPPQRSYRYTQGGNQSLDFEAVSYRLSFIFVDYAENKQLYLSNRFFGLRVHTLLSTGAYLFHRLRTLGCILSTFLNLRFWFWHLSLKPCWTGLALWPHRWSHVTGAAVLSAENT